MTARRPAHGRPHTRFARACDRLSRGLAWVYDHTRPHRGEEEPVWCAQCDEDAGPCTCTGFCGRIVCMAELDRLPEEGEDGYDADGRCLSCGAEVDHYLGCPSDLNADCEAEAGDPQDVPRPADEQHMSVETPGAAGPGYFHDDAPAEALKAVPLGDGTYGYNPAELDDTIVNLRPEPRSGAPAWSAQLRRDRQRAPAWVQRILDAPISEVHRALAAPDPDMYLWNASQQRALAGA